MRRRGGTADKRPRTANVIRRMAGTDKPYRVYRGGRTKGKVPLPHRRPTPRTQDGWPQPDDGAPRYPGPGPAAPERRPRWGRRIGILLVILLLALLAWGVASYLAVRKGVEKANARLPEEARVNLKHQDSLLLSTPTNILVLGTDHAKTAAREDANRSDSIMLIRTDPDRHRVWYLSIPRDLRVPIPGYGEGKVNAAMQLGGPALAIRTVEAATNEALPVNHVLVADFAQFEDTVNALGGITVDVPAPILSRFGCPFDVARCQTWKGYRFAKGVQHMNGRRALIYSRVRKNELDPRDSDFTRTERQQQVLQAVLRKMTSVKTVGKLPLIGDELVAPLTTDLTTAQLLQIGWVYKRGSAMHCRLGGSAATLPSGESVIVAEGDDKSRVILAMLGKTAPLAPRPGEGPYGAGCVRGAFPR
jgi:LCP family protein required for cell wall assembly